MREWLSGGAPPCQGGGRGFDPRLALEGGFRIVRCGGSELSLCPDFENAYITISCCHLLTDTPDIDYNTYCPAGRRMSARAVFFRCAT